MTTTTTLAPLPLAPTTLLDEETSEILERLARAAGTASLGMRYAIERATRENGLADLAALLHTVAAEIEATHAIVDRASLRS